MKTPPSHSPVFYEGPSGSQGYDDVIKWKHSRVTDPLSTGHRWVSLTKFSHAKIWCFLWSAPEHTAEQTIGTSVDLIRHRGHYDVTVMLRRARETVMCITASSIAAPWWCWDGIVYQQVNTVYPKKYAHGFRFAVLCCDYTLTNFPISIRFTSLALWQSNDCPSASKATLMNMDKYFMWIHYERLHNHNKAKHNKTVCIFLGIYCTTAWPRCNLPPPLVIEWTVYLHKQLSQDQY